MKSITQKPARALIRGVAYSFYWVFSKFPFPIVKLIGGMSIPIVLKFATRHYKIARKSLRLAFGLDFPQESMDRIMHDCFENVGRGMIEMLYFMSRPHLVSEVVSYEGKHHLDQALKEGKGVVAVIAHFGNFPLMMMALAQEGYPTNSIVRRARDEKLEQYLLQKRNECRLGTVYSTPRNKCVTHSLKVLRNNEILFIPADQNFGAEAGVYVDFFGRKAATATGPVVFAARTKAAVIPMFIRRVAPYKHKIIVEAPMEMVDTGNNDEDILTNTANVTKLIERYVRAYPHEWGWMHRRWRSRPYFMDFCPNA